jgi:hypothetical protein
MAITVTNAYIETFESNVRQLAQQNNSRLRMCVTEVNKQSEKHNWDRLAASTARTKSSARMVSPAGGNGSGAVGATDGLAWTRRNTTIATYDTGEVIEPENIVQMLIDPKSAATANLVMNMKRKVDDIIIAAATGAAGDGAGSTVAFPAGQTIGDYSGEITLDTILQVDELFYTNDVDPDEPRYFVIGPKQRRKLLQLIEVTSSDFQARQALATGYLPDFLGFNWIVSNRLLAPSTDQLDCLAFTKKALGLHVAGDIRSRVAERPDMSFAWQVYLMMNMAAVRVEDEHIVRFKAADTVT